MESSHKPSNGGSEAKENKQDVQKSELLIKLDSIYSDSNLDPAVKVEQLYKFYVEVALEELRQVHKQLQSLKLQEELSDYKLEVFDGQRQKA